jgi:bacillithiol system protein YtxJ
MNWIPLREIQQIDQLILQSQEPGVRAVLVFKHSTRCSISSMAHSRLERSWKDDPSVPAYYLDLLQYRPVSNEVAQRFGVEHESPQVLLIKEGKCIYNASHSAITADDILSAIKS